MFERTASVVVIEDSIDDAFEIDCQLNGIEGLEHHFQHFTDPDQGLKRIAEGDVDVVFLDFHLHGGSPMKLISEIRGHKYDNSLIMLLDDGDEQHIPSLIEQGADDCLSKRDSDSQLLQRCWRNASQQSVRRRAAREQKDMLTRTLSGSVRALVEIIATVRPVAFTRSQRARPLVKHIAQQIRVPNLWEIEVAATLSLLGCLSVPERLVSAVERNIPLTYAEEADYYEHAQFGATLIERIPRLEGVAEIVRYQEKRFDGGGYPKDKRRGCEIPLGSRIVKVALDFQRMLNVGTSAETAVRKIKERDGWYDADVVSALHRAVEATTHYKIEKMWIRDLTPDMVLDEHIVNASGAVLVPYGTTVGSKEKQKLLEALYVDRVREPVKVRIPVTVFSQYA